MDIRCQFLRKDFINRALAGNTRHALELVCCYFHPKMALSLGAGAGMTRMQMRFVDNDQSGGGKRFIELMFYGCCD